MTEELEKIIHSCNSIHKIRNSSSKNPGMKEAFHNSLQPTLCLLTEVMSRLKLKEEPIQVQTPCSKEEIEHLWECIHEIVALCYTEFLDGCSEFISPHYFATRLANTLCYTIVVLSVT